MSPVQFAFLIADVQLSLGAYLLGGPTAAGYIMIGLGVFTYFIAWFRA